MGDPFTSRPEGGWFSTWGRGALGRGPCSLKIHVPRTALNKGSQCSVGGLYLEYPSAGAMKIGESLVQLESN